MELLHTERERERKGGNACAVEHTQLTANGAIQNNKSRGRERGREVTHDGATTHGEREREREVMHVQ